jgi:hypothetical protein
MRNWDSDLRQLWVHWMPWSSSRLHEELREWPETVVSSMSAMEERSAPWGIERVIWDVVSSSKTMEVQSAPLRIERKTWNSCEINEINECNGGPVVFMINREKDLRQLWDQRIPWRPGQLHEELKRIGVKRNKSSRALLVDSRCTPLGGEGASVALE